MKIAVLGGAGFIGSAFVRELNKRGIKPLVIDLLTYAGRLENLKDTEHEFIKADIRDLSTQELLQNVDIVVNFAAETHVDR
ncbi:MAG: NAD-dependent epimerase/dehydratase family protein, partial [Candidatus Nanopusillus sp.]|nr:NAD-dependent epimerase/dehydratase family protein [Candidatus Nanopusillus sp.]